MISKVGRIAFWISLAALSSCVRDQDPVDLPSRIQNQIVQDHIADLRSFSERFKQFSEAENELKKGLFNFNQDVVRASEGRINLVSTGTDAIAIARTILPSFASRRLDVDPAHEAAFEFEDLWIVVFQTESFEHYDPTRSVVIVLSRHTAEVLRIYVS